MLQRVRWRYREMENTSAHWHLAKSLGNLPSCTIAKGLQQSQQLQTVICGQSIDNASRQLWWGLASRGRPNTQISSRGKQDSFAFKTFFSLLVYILKSFCAEIPIEQNCTISQGAFSIFKSMMKQVNLLCKKCIMMIAWKNK